MTTPADRQRMRAVERRVATEYARDKVAHALYEVLVDGLEFGPCELRQAEDREWIRGAVAIPLQEATDAALGSLCWAMARALESAPDGLLDRYERSHRVAELGWE